MTGRFDRDLERTPANHAPLTPLVFLEWAADTYPGRPAVIHGARRYTWGEFRSRCRRLASALRGRGVGAGDTVSVLLANTPEMIEAHFGVPMTQAVLHTINTRLDPAAVAFQIGHAGTRVLLVDREFAAVARRAVERLPRRPEVVAIDDPEFAAVGERFGDLEYEALLAGGDPDRAAEPPADEWQAISLNYTSGTTGDPRGVVYHHRGAHLNALSNVLLWGMPRHAVYLWTLPMFHCNGWCFPWTSAAIVGVNVCLRRFSAGDAFRLMREHRVTHYCGAPIVHAALAAAAAAQDPGLGHRVAAMIGGAPPPPAMIERLETMGVDLTHTYGLTETYGPGAVNAPHAAWETLAPGERAERIGRQGVRAPLLDAMEVVDPATQRPVPRDGRTLGEIVFRGNTVMRGYLDNPRATAAAFQGGWFHSGDLAVVDPDGYVKIRDRSKDIIISGGENIASLEVEEVLYRHPAVEACAVVAQPDPRWGETPCAFVELRPGAAATEAELIAHCRDQLAHFKAPRTVAFGPLPRTSTGKIQKFVLRERAGSCENSTDPGAA